LKLKKKKQECIRYKQLMAAEAELSFQNGNESRTLAIAEFVL
jgi:hypothetical protein